MTKDAWCHMWHAIKAIELNLTKQLLPRKIDIETIKHLIQIEIGPME